MSFAFPTPEDFGGVANDETVSASLNHDAIMNCLAAESICYIDPTKFYGLGYQINPDNGHKIKGGGQLLLLTDSGKFDVADYGHSFAANSCGIYAEGKTGVELDVNVVAQASGGTRTCSAIALRNCIDAKVRARASGFTDPELPIISFDSMTGGEFKVRVKDCTTNNASLRSQMTGVGFDGNRVSDGMGGSINSTHWMGDIRCSNLTQGAASLAAWGQQTTGLGLYTIGYAGANVRLITDTVGQGLDLYGQGNVIDMVARDSGAYGLKMMYSAARNNIKAAIRNGGIAPIVLGSYTNVGVPDPVRDNFIEATVVIDKQVWSNAQVPAFSIDGISGATQPTNNHIRLLARGDGAHMNYAVDVGAGQGNYIEDLGSSGWAVAHSRVQGGFSLPLINPTARIKRSNGTFIRVYDNNSGVISSHFSAIPYDTKFVDSKGEFNTTTKKFTAQNNGFVNMLAQIEVTNVQVGKQVEIRIERTRGAVVADIGRRIEIASIASTPTSPLQLSLPMFGVDVQPGDSFRVWIDWNQSGSLNINNVSTATYWLIEEC